MAGRKGIRLLRFKNFFQKGESNSETFGDNVAHTKDINEVSFQNRSFYTRHKIGVAIVLCLLIITGVVLAIYFATTESDNKDGRSEKGKLSVTDRMPSSISQSTDIQNSPSAATESASSTMVTKPYITTETTAKTPPSSATTMTTKARSTTEPTTKTKAETTNTQYSSATTMTTKASSTTEPTTKTKAETTNTHYPAATTMTTEARSTTEPTTKTKTKTTNIQSSAATTMTTKAAMTTQSTTTTTTQRTTTEDTALGLAQWGEWTACTVTCGSGIHKRYRDCSSETQTCFGDYTETRVCKMNRCPVHGAWTTWSSWGSCDVTCGGGKQVRSRSCKKENAQDFDCVGRQSQNQNCNVFRCPDCSRQCTTGTLNEACDACICESVVTSGRVVSAKTRNPIGGAVIYDSDARQRSLTISNSTGFFTLNNTCTTTRLLVTREGFVNKEIEEMGTYVEIQLDKLVLPHFAETPESKYRLQGENVTMCCAAKANPPISYYEWFKDGILLDETFLPNGTSLTLLNVSVQDSGQYQCRANSLSYSAIMSPVAFIKVKESSNEFCSDALKEKIIPLPADCVQPLTNTSTYKVRACIEKGCRKNGILNNRSCRDTTEACCTPINSQFKTVSCSGYQLEVLDVTACGCRACTSNIISLTGNVKGKGDMIPIAGAEVWINGDLMTSTNYKGIYNVRFSKTTETVVINVKDTRSRYLDAIKIINIKSNLAGTLRVNMKLLKANVPVEIDSTVQNTVKAGTLVGDNSVPRLELSIPANSYYLPNGTIYNGTVCAFLTFIDPADASFADATPGIFQFIGTMGEPEALDSLGVFNMFFEDSTGNDIVIKDPIDVYVPYEVEDNETSENFQLWTLSGETGLWVLDATATDNKRKRRNTGGWIGEIDWSTISGKVWKNIDRVPEKTTACYFKLKLYKNDQCTEEIQNVGNIDIEIHMINGSVFLTDKNYISNTEDQCVPTACREDIKDKSAYITVFYNGRFGKEALYAATPVVQSGLNYTIAASDESKTLKIEMIRTESGPFYEDESKCLADPDYYLRYYEIKDDKLSEFTSLKYAKDEISVNETTLSNRQKAWYTEDQSLFQMCMIKVGIEQYVSSQYDNESFTVRVSSSGGTIAASKDKIFGIRDHKVAIKSGKLFLCLEYKCSGKVPTAYNSTDYTDFATDYVNISIIPMVAYHTYGYCSVNFVSNSLVNESPPDNNDKNQVGNKQFQIFAPTGFAYDYGLYDYPMFCSSNSCTDGVEKKAREKLMKECKDGEADDNDDNTEDIAVGFQCRFK
ncbi:cartilage intermediate layer protein 1-like [Mercenaria mercenaria]|uniref:cartilage intermediate layer protein 1-like n=1 Tax=Mercenaria mercenaria TaxID=6596 RepID=UPI00234F34D7|nr:cartilage intermediate layer protein 1-like [Mercenaria mercenaria]